MLKVTDRAAIELKKSVVQAGTPNDWAVKVVPGNDTDIALAMSVPMEQDEIVYEERDLVVSVDGHLKQPLNESVLDIESAAPDDALSGVRFVLRHA